MDYLFCSPLGLHYICNMKENVFIKKNIEKWKNMSAGTNIDPEAMADAYLDLTSDLAYVQTHYPDSPLNESLNDMAFKMHNIIYRKKGNTFPKFIKIWTEGLPKIMYESRYVLLFSFAIFMLFTLFGVISQINNTDYAKDVLGVEYVSQTIENIEQGKPTDIYNSEPETSMFLSITLNNLLVDLKTFAYGIFTSLGAIIILFYNAIMLGSFQTFFFQYGVGWESVLSIWQHGALEIPAIIISGAAGITLGNGWLFPKSYSRLQAFKLSAKKGLKIMLGVIPITIIAGFIESFITRHVETPTPIRIAAIVVEFAFVIFYFVLLPMKYRNKESRKNV